ncbi:MAG: SDR family NAD(P)-dependent oxidoreductase [Treponema sp.]|nr:SDR family NAD(P)-dependent oxidoreductase [Treponema sp.]
MPGSEEKSFALVTGASSGIGLAISRELAQHGYPLLLVSNEEAKLNEAASELTNNYHVRAIPLYMDLAQRDSAQNVFDYCQTNNIKIEILINNAGIFFFKDIIDTSGELIEKSVNLHIFTPTMLCRLFAHKIIHENRKGYILNMASIASWMMMPGIALYSAAKSYLRCFSRAMRCEIYDRNVSITTVCPGAVATGLYNLPERYMKLGIRLGIIITTERLAALALKKMFKRKAQFIPGGLINRLFIFLVNAMPEALVRQIKRKIDNKLLS